MFNKAVLNPTVLALGFVSLFADIASEMLYPITPIFLTSVLGASMTSVGIIEGIAEATASLLKTYSGNWSDRIQHRKYFVVAGYTLSAISKPLIGLASGWGLVLFSRGLDRTGKGVRSAPRDALLAESVSAEYRGQAFGWHRLMDTTGAFLGPLLAIWLIKAYSDNLRTIYYWAIIPGLVSVIFALAVKEKPSLAEPVKRTWSWSGLPPAYKKYAWAWVAFSVGNSSDVFLLMRAKEAGSSTSTVIFMYCFYNLVYALASPYLGFLSDQWGRSRCLKFGLLVFALVYAGFSQCSQTWEFFLLFGVYGLYMAGTDGVGKAYAIDLMPKDRKATAIGILGTVTGLATLVSSVLAGYLWDHFSYRSTFYLGMLGSVVGLVLLQLIPQEKQAPETA